MTKVFWALGFIGVFVVTYLVLQLISVFPVIGIVLLSVVGLFGTLGLSYGVYILADRISEHHHRIAGRNFDRMAIQGRFVQDQEDTRYEREQRLQIEQRKLDLEDRKLRLEAYKAQAVTVGKDQSLVVRDYSGQRSYVAYERQARVYVQEQETSQFQLEELQRAAMIEAPRTPQARTALELLEAGELDSDDIVLGQKQNGQLVRRSWKQILSILILGFMGGGKTNTVSWILLQLMLKGYKIALVDRHAKSDESTHARLKELVHMYDVPVGDNPQSAMRVARHVRNVFESRMTNGVSNGYKLIYCVEEFSALMRAKGDKESEWGEVAAYVQNLIEDLGYEGRKYGVHVVAIGQATNASRSGGTEIRDLFHTRIVHGMKARQAQNIGMTEQKGNISKLETGQTIIDVEGREDPFFCQVPEVTEEFQRAIVARLAPKRRIAVQSDTRGANDSNDSNGRRTVPFTPRSVDVRTGNPNGISPTITEAMDAVRTQIEEDELKSFASIDERTQRVLSLRKLGAGKAAIILETWGAKKGSSEAYKQAEQEYTQIIEKLTQLGRLEA